LRRRTTISQNPRLEFQKSPRIMIYDYHQDDPSKCTSAKLQKFQLAQQLRSLREIPRSAIILNPSSNLTLSFQDRSVIEQYGLVGLDCSWNSSEEILQNNIKGENRRLPTLLAGNPTNYSIRGRLSTAEALAAALIITGFEKEARSLLAIFNWGNTFLTLNKEPLETYAHTLPSDMSKQEQEYFPPSRG
jgi:rRNA small subunit aminocarboxypropyltransferase